MAAILKCLDRRSGITYVYESISYWDKEKKQSRAHRKLIGRYNPETGEVTETKGWGKRRGMGKKTSAEKKKGAGRKAQDILINAKRQFHGAAYLLDRIGEETGVAEDLRKCFPADYKQMLSLVYYLILGNNCPLYRFNSWGRLHTHPYGDEISSQRSSELLQSISETDKMEFFRLQARRRSEKEYWAYDTTSISSYSELLREVKYGKNKDGDNLPQINLALLFGEKSGLPFYYKKLPGNITDVKTVNNLLKEFDLLGYGNVSMVMDRGFYSADNVTAMYRKRHKFLMGAGCSLKYVKEYINEIRGKKENYENYLSGHTLYAFSKEIDWQIEPRKTMRTGNARKTETQKMWLHVYYSPARQLTETSAFNKRLDELKEELMSGHRTVSHDKSYEKYFVVKETAKGNITVIPKSEEINKAKENFGFFALVSNAIQDADEALCIYRCKDVVEKGFGNIKEHLNCDRLFVSSETALDGKLFVVFLSLIYLSSIKKRMETAGLFGKYTMHGLFDELETIECFTVEGKEAIIGEVTKKQEQLYASLGVKPLYADGKQN